MIHGQLIQDPAFDKLRHRLIHHPLYQALTDLGRLRIFMEHHVFAVWDFMSIVKSLQRDLTGITIPWIPSLNAQAARLINEIVLVEECDAKPDGSYASHYQFYLDAMEELGADTSRIKRFLREVQSGKSVSEALQLAEAPPPARRFVEETFATIEGARLNVRAAALFYGREDLIPAMFKPMVEEMGDSGLPCEKFVYYLERHIEVDGGEHSIMAESILKRLCGDSEDRKEAARQTALSVLRSRLNFWDGIHEAVRVRVQSEQLTPGA